ncbi:DUF2637 domain-containing protein [Leucobacter chromiireducens]|uniref:DUF2637 domain-containing protein n=1 Tax=Leucobacter chromiireducens subsp. solipictus TaxID=398235 RepID=A0ABS1SG63_9MICO|nr:DUF2637 domain-containing protein [Leucobacter chromiireducens]MBL3679530.1 DUF2637 domain-containing protein [Leucobacter chromiireducens subsp. solipictus]
MTTGTAGAETLSLDHAGRGVQVALTITLMIVAVSAFVLGALPLISIAQEWAGLPTGVAALLPVVLDAGAVAAALAAIVRHTRGQRATLETALLLLTVVVSVCAQVVHAWQIEGGVWEPRTVIIAAALGSAPVIVLLASHAAIRTLTPPRQKRSRSARRNAGAAQKPAPTAAHTSTSGGVAAKPAAPKPAAAAAPKPTPPADLPERLADEADLDYAMRLLEHGYGQRKAAELAGTTRSKIETRLKQRAAAEATDQPALAA